jgi:hypothetical protein
MAGREACALPGATGGMPPRLGGPAGGMAGRDYGGAGARDAGGCPFGGWAGDMAGRDGGSGCLPVGGFCCGAGRAEGGCPLGPCGAGGCTGCAYAVGA